MAEDAKYMTEEEKKDKQYERLIAARNFHYDNLNKWLITFYAIIGALFLALWTLHASATMHRYMELCVAIVGYVVSIGAILSIKGYYYWETNWIMLVHYFEKNNFKENGERVYSVFANKNANNCVCNPVAGTNVSTSKVALAITTFIAVLWGTFALYFSANLLMETCEFKDVCPKSIVVPISMCISCLMTMILLYKGAERFSSDLSGLDDLNIPLK